MTKLIILNKCINKTISVKLTFLLFSFVFMQFLTAAPLKISDARWKTGWNHPGANTSSSPDKRTITTILPAVNSINSDYTAYFDLFTNAGNPLPITLRPLTHAAMIKCPNFKPGPNKPIVSSYCIASRYTPSDGMRRLTQPTTVKIEARSPGGGIKYLYWKFIPKLIPLPVSCNWNFDFSDPGNNQHFPAGTKVFVKAQIQRGTSVIYMDLYLNNQLIRRDQRYPYEWGHAVNDFKLRGLQPGTHTLKIKAKDNCGITKEKTRVFYIDSAPANNRGDNNNACNGNFSIYRPNGSNYSSGSDIYVKANAEKYQDITWMKLYVNNQFVRKESSNPYEWGKPNSNGDNALRNMQPGTYVLRIEAKNNCEMLLKTKSKTIYIQN